MSETVTGTDVSVIVTITDGGSAFKPDSPLRSRGLAVVLTVLFVAWVMGWLWWLATAAAFCTACWWVHGRIGAAAAERAAIIARADQQHAWAMAGDPRGTYGRS